MKFLQDKIKGTKLAMRCLREGNELLEAQDTEAKDFDDQWLIESKDLKWSFPMVARAIRHKQTKLVVYEPQKSEVFAGIQGDYADRDYCKKNKIEVTPFPTPGGALVTNKGDLLFIYIRPNKKGAFQFLEFVRPLIASYLLYTLSEAGVKGELTMSGNDIEVNGKKLSGSSTAHKMGAVMESIFVSGVNNQATLEAVGHKGKPREITSLTELGINVQDFRDWIIEATRNAYKQRGVNIL